MRPATAREILRRHAAGHPPETIAAQMHIGKKTVHETITDNAGKPPAEDHNRATVWAHAATIASCAAAIRVNEEWVHTYTAGLTLTDLRALLAVAAAMLPPDVNPREALAWADDGPKRGRPPKTA